MSQSDVIIGVTGGVAAYKTAALVSRLVQDEVSVRVVMTPSAEKFVGKATFAALTGKGVVTEIFDPTFPLGAHIELARDSRLLCIAPATANLMASAATGSASDLLSTLYLCFMGPVLMAPAMNCEMWDKPSVQRNLKQLVEDGVQMIGPEEGWLSCRVKGKGRMSEPDVIFDAIKAKLETTN